MFRLLSMASLRGYRYLKTYAALLYSLSTVNGKIREENVLLQHLWCYITFIYSYCKTLQLLKSSEFKHLESGRSLNMQEYIYSHKLLKIVGNKICYVCISFSRRMYKFMCLNPFSRRLYKFMCVYPFHGECTSLCMYILSTENVKVYVGISFPRRM